MINYFILEYVNYVGVVVLPEGCAGLPKVPKPALNAWGASNPPPKLVIFKYK